MFASHFPSNFNRNYNLFHRSSDVQGAVPIGLFQGASSVPERDVDEELLGLVEPWHGAVMNGNREILDEGWVCFPCGRYVWPEGGLYFPKRATVFPSSHALQEHLFFPFKKWVLCCPGTLVTTVTALTHTVWQKWYRVVPRTRSKEGQAIVPCCLGTLALRKQPT